MSESNEARPPEVRVNADVVARETYRHLRLMLVTLSLLILLAILALALQGKFEGSISAYYSQTIRDVFVGGMVGIAVCLVVYRGYPPFEDFVFNLAGFFAVFVAFVPNTFKEDLAGLTSDERVDALAGLRASLAVLVVVAVLLVAFERRLGRLSVRTLNRRPVTRSLLILASVVAPLFLALVVWAGFLNDEFVGVHPTAAVLFFACLGLGVATHGWPGAFGGDATEDQVARRVLALMVLAAPVVAVLLALVGRSAYIVIGIEFAEIAIFAAYWVREAKRTWDATPPAPGALPA
jgi:hypothetical protein